MAVSYITHFSRTIMSINISTSLTDVEIIQTYEKAYKLLKLYRKKEKLLVLHDIGNTKISHDVIKFIIPKFMEVRDKILRRAFLITDSGTNAFFELFIDTLKIQKNSKRFDNSLKALDWLVYGTDEPRLILTK